MYIIVVIINPGFSLNNKLLNYNIYPLSDEAIRMRIEQHKDY